MTSRLHEFLKDLRVLDLSRHLPGPLATLMLSDMGASVLKIESPEGDEMRRWGARDAAGRPVMFEAVNAGKRTMRLDLKSDEGREALLGLVDTHDVLIESFRPGVLDRLGIGHADLRRHNPRLIICALSGYGQGGPLSGAAGHDINYLSQGGLLYGNGTPASPSMIYPPIADCTGSMFAAVSILGALRARDRDGQGCVIDIALADVCAPFQLFDLARLGLCGQPPQRGGEWINGGWACYQIYATADHRHVSLGAVEQKFWAAFCRASGHEEWIARQDEPAPQVSLVAEVAAHIGALSLAECVACYGPADCCLTPIDDIATAVQSERARSRGLVRRHPDLPIYEAAFPAIVDGEVPQHRTVLQVVQSAGAQRGGDAHAA
jgi:alpha-methylacyl-CoA racemase